MSDNSSQLPFREGVGRWKPRRPRLEARRLAVAWLVSAVALFAAAWIVPGGHVPDFYGALATAALVGLLNALLPPVVAALRLPYTVGAGFILVLVVDALSLLIASEVDDRA